VFSSVEKKKKLSDGGRLRKYLNFVTDYTESGKSGVRKSGKRAKMCAEFYECGSASGEIPWYIAVRLLPQ